MKYLVHIGAIYLHLPRAPTIFKMVMSLSVHPVIPSGSMVPWKCMKTMQSMDTKATKVKYCTAAFSISPEIFEHLNFVTNN